MTLTAWNAASGPGADFLTKAIVIEDCVPGSKTQLKQSYRVMGDPATVNSSVQLDPMSDDRFQRVMRVHLSHPYCTQTNGPNGCIRTNVYSDDLASVWNASLMGVILKTGIAMPEVQLRFIQSIDGNQVKRATLLYKPTSAGGAATLQGIAQFHGWESTDFEIWAWIDPEVNGTIAVGAVQLIFEVGVKMCPSSGNNVLINTDIVSAIP